MAHRDFDAARREVEREPVTFTMRGQTFTTAPIGVGPMLDLIDAPEQDVAQQVRGLRNFLDSILVDDDVPRFRALLASKIDPVGLDELMALVEWLAEVHTGRPSQPSSPSGQSSSSDGRSSSGDPVSEGGSPA